MDSPSTIRALFQSGEAADLAANTVSDAELPPPTSSQTFVVSEGGAYVSKPVTGTTNEVSIASTSTTITFAFDAGFILKGVNTAAGLRTAAGLGTMALAAKIAAVADLNQTISNPPTQAEVQAITDKIDELLGAARTATALLP